MPDRLFRKSGPQRTPRWRPSYEWDSTGFRPEDVLWPLNDVERRNAPERLYLAGDASLLRHRPKVSIVGSREASEEGRRRAARLAKIAVQHNVVVVSGLAKGIDHAAHTAAMEAGGRTIAVVGTSLDKAYPRENAELQDRIAHEHLVVSEFPAEHITRKWDFPRRNRTMALIVDASVIVEAGETSGTLSQGWEALRLGRPLFIMQSVLEQVPALKWPEQMQQYGAEILATPDALLDALPYGDPVEALLLT